MFVPPQIRCEIARQMSRASLALRHMDILSSSFGGQPRTPECLHMRDQCPSRKQLVLGVDLLSSDWLQKSCLSIARLSPAPVRRVLEYCGSRASFYTDFVIPAWAARTLGLPGCLKRLAQSDDAQQVIAGQESPFSTSEDT